MVLCVLMLLHDSRIIIDDAIDIKLTYPFEPRDSDA